MDILRINTSPIFEIVPRKKLDVLRVLKLALISEYSENTQNILCSVTLISNENYVLSLNSFPASTADEKFSYTLLDNITNEVVLMGRLMIISENETVQDYAQKTNTKYYS